MPCLRFRHGDLYIRFDIKFKLMSDFVFNLRIASSRESIRNVLANWSKSFLFMSQHMGEANNNLCYTLNLILVQSMNENHQVFIKLELNKYILL